MHKLQHLSLTARVISLMCLVAFGFMCLFGWLLIKQRAVLYQEKGDATRQIVEIGHGIVEQHVRAATAAGGSAANIAAAKQQALTAIRALRYNSTDYLWLNDLEPRMVMHPTQSKLDGQSLVDYADPTGKKIFMEMVAIARDRGEGQLDYVWPKPGETIASPKISYVKLVPEWGWIVGSGIYVDDIEAEVRMVGLQIVGGFLLTLLITLSVGYLVARRTTQPVLVMVEQMLQGADQVSSTSGQIATSAQSLAQGASEQAASLEETSASLEEMSALTRTTADDAGRAAVTVAEAARLAGTAQAALADMIRSMNAIEQSSSKVAKIIKTIDEIAFQTNLLALNAAVEAARAGEAGMGFAVVADEVRALAQRSAQAAKDTAVMIEESISSAKEGVREVDTVAGSINAVTTTAGEVKILVDRIAEASRQQATGIDQVNRAVSEMGTVTQTTAAAAEESAAASEELNAQAETTRATVQRLDELVRGTSAAPAAASATVAPAPIAARRRKPAQPTLPAQHAEYPVAVNW